MTAAIQFKNQLIRKDHVQCGHKRNTNSQNKPNAHLAVIERHGHSMVEVLSGCSPVQVNIEARLCSRSERVGHADSQGTFGAM